MVTKPMGESLQNRLQCLSVVATDEMMVSSPVSSLMFLRGLMIFSGHIQRTPRIQLQEGPKAIL